MAYYQSPNRFSTNMPEDRPMHPGGKHDSYSFSSIGHEVLCCVGNLNRVIPNYIMHMWMATPDKGLAATLHGPANVRAVVAGGVPVEISADTQYPFEDTIRLKLATEKQVDFPLYVRLPEWSADPSAEINGETVSLREVAKGFARIERTWSDGDSVTLRFPMAVTIEHGRETDYPNLEYYERKGRRRLSRERGIQNPFASVFRGPLLFALPIPDDGPNKVAESVDFNYALDFLPGAPGASTKLERQPMPSRWQWKLEETPLRLLVPARAFPWKPDELEPLPPKPVSGGEKAAIELVPYGVTKFRVSMFPVTTSMWRSIAQ
ncbi:MAG: hypothetical protein GY953_47800 [bacterium]|nr:hypothetical protein [bacterium]